MVFTSHLPPSRCMVHIKFVEIASQWIIPAVSVTSA